MTKIEHLQFLVLMIPTLLILAAAAVSMADLAMPATPETYAVAAADHMLPAEAVWDDRPAQ
ncbi:MAG: hypothetical protein ACREUS_03695 [Burkholderiales bacterium]